jgi:hypothetical protein
MIAEIDVLPSQKSIEPRAFRLANELAATQFDVCPETFLRMAAISRPSALIICESTSFTNVSHSVPLHKYLQLELRLDHIFVQRVA